MKVSGFTFIHNALKAGLPITEAITAVASYVDEMVVIDMQSDDGTRELLEWMDVRIIDGEWTPGGAGACLAAAHALHTRCEYDVIWHFEGDEVFSESLALAVSNAIQNWDRHIAVHRIQVEQNFQRVRWYPTLVHRVFRKGSVVKQGESTVEHKNGTIIPKIIEPECGLLWDVTNCFRDNYLARCEQQAELWGGRVNRAMVDIHSYHPVMQLTEQEAQKQLEDERWEWNVSPFDLPKLLEPYVGMTKYEPEKIWNL